MAGISSSGGKTGAVVRAVQEAIDVIEDGLLGNGAGIAKAAAHCFQYPVGDTVLAGVGGGISQQAALLDFKALQTA